MFKFLKILLFTIIFFPIFIVELILYKFLNIKNSELSYQYLIRLSCLSNGISNRFIHKMTRLKKINLKTNLDFKKKFNEINKKIKQRGFFLKKNFITPSKEKKIVNYLIKKCTGKFESDFYKSKYFTKVNINKPLATTFRYKTEDLLNNNEIQKIIINENILKICQNYFNASPIIDIVSSWWSFPSSEPDNYSAQYWHFDMDRPKWLKVFIFLTDCNHGNGPHYFIEGSHKTIPFAIRMKGYTRILDSEIKNNYSTNKIIKMLANKRSLLIEDTSGLHKGEKVEKKNRLIIQIQYSSALFGSKEIKKIKFPENACSKLILFKKKYPNLFLNFI